MRYDVFADSNYHVCMPKISVITVSDRSAAGTRPDKSGPLACQLLADYGQVEAPTIVPDQVTAIQDAIKAAVAGGADIIFTTGGTGFSTRDVTPEATAPLLSKRAGGIEAALRDNPKVPAAALSRGVAGVIDLDGTRAFVVNAPGSTGGVKDAVAAVGPLISHITEQLADAAHTAPAEKIGLTPHQRATHAVQNRGYSDGSDAQVVWAGVTDQPIDVAALQEAVRDPQAGAVALFDGRVRNHDDGQGVVSIDYEAHPDAGKVVERIAKACAKGSGAAKLAIAHRYGHLEVGDVAFAAAASAAHRREAFELLEKAVEQVKAELPVWKKQQFTDGSHAWTGSA